MQGIPDADPMINLRRINKAYQRGQEQVDALKNVTMKIEKEKFASAYQNKYFQVYLLDLAKSDY